MSPLYLKVMAVLERANIPASVRADVDHVFHNPDDVAAPDTAYNPDNYAPPPNQYPHWVEAGSPPYDVFGRELDVRGWPTGNMKPATPPADTPQRGTYFQERVGDMPGSGYWRVGFSDPGQRWETTYTISEGYATVLQAFGDGGYPNGDVEFTLYAPGSTDGVVVPFGSNLPTQGGGYTLVAVCLKNAHTEEHGSLATFSIVKNA